MLGAANVGADAFDLLLDHSRYDYDLFAPPNPSLSTVDHAIGLHASALVRDAGTLQIGIGELGDSIVYSLLLRHQQNEAWRRALSDAGTERARGARRRDRRPRALRRRIVRRHRDVRRPDARPVSRRNPAPPRLRLSTAAARARGERLEHARRRGVARRAARRRRGADARRARMSRRSRRAGVLRSETRFDDGAHRLARRRAHRRRIWETRRRACALARECLGLELQGGTVMHAGFLLGPRAFYAALRELPESERRLFDMRGVGFINQLYGDDCEPASRAAQPRAFREHHDDADDARRGGVGRPRRRPRRVGRRRPIQFRRDGARAARRAFGVCACARRASRTASASSNIVTQYGHITIPRHLRDIAITEYGIADLRGRTDGECVAAMVNIADSRFQDELLTRRAKRANKIDAGYRIPGGIPAQHARTARRRRSPSPRRAGLFSEYPFGTDLTREEIDLARALRWLKEHTGSKRGAVDDVRARAVPYTRRRATAAISTRLDLAAPKISTSV